MWSYISKVVAHHLLVARESLKEIWQNNTLVLVAARTRVSEWNSTQGLLMVWVKQEVLK